MSYHKSPGRGAAPRRGTRSELVDCRNLASFILRRCEGCTLEKHLEVAERFFDAQDDKFDDATQAEVLKLVRNHARTERPKQGPDGEVVNGSVMCSICGRRYYEHELDKEFPWLTRVCGGKRVRVT